MHIVVSGASGFIGSWICRYFAENHQITGIIRTSSSSARLTGIKNLRILRSDPENWPNLIRQYKPDCLILADWQGVGNTERNSELQFNNIQRVIHVAEAAKFASTKIVIGLGSQAELGPVNGLIHEKLEDNPTTQYGCAKVSTRLELNKLFLNTDTRFHWFRIFSVYGPLDIGPWLIPQLVDSLLDQKPLKLTRGEQEWSYLHIYDLVRAMEYLLQNSMKSEICNVGNPQTITIRNAVTMIARFLNSESFLKFGELAYRPDQVMQLKPMCESLTSVGWQPKVSFQNGIEHTINWLRGVDRNHLELMNGDCIQTFLPMRSSIENST